MDAAKTQSCQALHKLLETAQLPALPQSAMRLLELSQDPDNGPAEFAVPIESDPGLAGQVLKFVNSSYFGFSREISSVKYAITLVGIRTIKNFALWSAVFSLMPNPKCGPFDLKNLWQDSLRRALFARAVARLLGMREPEETFAAALLQDMAVPLLAKELPADYLKMLESRAQDQRRLSTLEQERFGWTHAEVAAQMARRWNMPEEFADLIEKHCSLDEILSKPKPRPDEASVALSSLLPSVADEQWTECRQLEAAYQKLRSGAAPTLQELLQQVDQELADFAPILKMSAPAKTLSAWYEESLAAAS